MINSQGDRGAGFDVVYELIHDDDSLILNAFIQNFRAGYLWGTLEGERITIEDLKVEDRVPRPWPMWDKLLSYFLGERRPLSARRTGIGTTLVRMLCQFADRNQVTEILGSVVKQDLDSQPWLLNWHEKQGFMIEGPSVATMQAAVKQIARRSSR